MLLALAVLALVLALLGVQRRVAQLHELIDDVADPELDLMLEAQYLLARQTASLRGFLLTRDSTFLGRYAVHREAENELHRRASELRPRLPIEVARDVAATSAASAAWSAQIRLEEITIAGAAGAIGEAEVLLEQELYDAALDAAARSALSLRELIRVRREEIDRVERNARLLFASLALLSGLLAVGALGLNARIRALAEEADRRRREAEEARRRMEEAVEEREALLRGFTHDVKNPLNAADGYADLLELGHRGDLPDGQRELVARIRGSIGRALAVIDELLEIARLEGGGVQLWLERVDLRALAADAVRAHQAAAARRDLDLRMVEDDGRPAVAVTDATRVRHVLDNLLGNAIKYTPAPGRVRVRVTRGSDGGGARRSHVTLTVSDSGPGIPTDERETIFREFRRLVTDEPGHGLGLAIGRKIARLLGGDLTVDEGPEGGAAFRLRLPAD